MKYSSEVRFILLQASNKNIGRFPKNVGSFSKNVGHFSAYLPRFSLLSDVLSRSQERFLIAQLHVLQLVLGFVQLFP